MDRRQIDRTRTIRIGSWLFGCWGHMGGWIRIFGYGISLVDHRKVRPLFSERNGRYRFVFHIGPWCLKWLGK